MISSTVHEEEEELPPPPPPKEEVVEEPVEEVAEVKEKKVDVNETYEMQMRRERLGREKKKKENLALKRGSRMQDRSSPIWI